MSYRLVIAEKPSVGAAYAKVLGATNCQDGYWEGNGYLVSWCMNRYVRRGSKGIALLDESGGYPRLHYVFDVSDTAPRRNALYPDLWQINESLKEPVRSMLAENYGVHSESFGQQLADVAGKLVADYPDYRKARNEMQELVRAQKNVERFFAEEKDTTEKTQTR